MFVYPLSLEINNAISQLIFFYQNSPLAISLYSGKVKYTQSIFISRFSFFSLPRNSILGRTLDRLRNKNIELKSVLFKRHIFFYLLLSPPPAKYYARS